MVFPIVSETLVEASVFILGDVFGLAHPDWLDLVKDLKLVGDLLDLLGLLVLLGLIILNLGLFVLLLFIILLFSIIIRVGDFFIS